MRYNIHGMITNVTQSGVGYPPSSGQCVHGMSWTYENAASALGNRYLFQGREYSWASGLYHFRARWYDPATGRWLSNDPIGISGGLNQYPFCGSDPVNYVDPSGLDVWIEGASGDEPYLHRGIAVGDPTGQYDTYSFGLASYLGNFYKESKENQGGKIIKYRKTTAVETARIRRYLEDIKKEASPYGPGATCRDFCRIFWKALETAGVGESMLPPHREIMGASNKRRLMNMSALGLSSSAMTTSTTSPGATAIPAARIATYAGSAAGSSIGSSTEESQ